MSTGTESCNARAQQLLGNALVWDNHACFPLRADARFLPELERYRAAGVNVVSLNVGFADMPWSEHLRVLSFMRQWVSRHPQSYQLVASVGDIARCKAAGRLGVVFDVEGMQPVEQDPSLVQTFYELGVRWMLIAYNQNNAAGGGCLDNDGGLTQLGRNIIDEMERVGMVLCLSHCGARTASEALEYARNPVIFSHSNPHGDTPHPRNISDQLMRACARQGGVVGLSGIGLFLGSNVGLVGHLLRQLGYVMNLVGPEHVGLGLDFVVDRTELDDYVRANPALFPPDIDVSGGLGMLAPESLMEIVEGLVRMGLADEQITGVLGGNWLRVARHVWR